MPPLAGGGERFSPVTASSEGGNVTSVPPAKLAFAEMDTQVQSSRCVALKVVMLLFPITPSPPGFARLRDGAAVMATVLCSDVT